MKGNKINVLIFKFDNNKSIYSTTNNNGNCIDFIEKIDGVFLKDSKVRKENIL